MLRTDAKAGSNFINISQNAVSIDGSCSTCWGIETCTVIVRMEWGLISDVQYCTC